MPSVLATIKVKEDKIEEAKQFLKDLSAETLASESGTGDLQEPVAKFDSVFSEPPNFSHYELTAEASAA